MFLQMHQSSIMSYMYKCCEMKNPIKKKSSQNDNEIYTQNIKKKSSEMRKNTKQIKMITFYWTISYVISLL